MTCRSKGSAARGTLAGNDVNFAGSDVRKNPEGNVATASRQQKILVFSPQNSSPLARRAEAYMGVHIEVAGSHDRTTVGHYLLVSVLSSRFLRHEERRERRGDVTRR